MKLFCKFVLPFVFTVSALWTTMIFAADELVTGDIGGTQTINSSEGIVFQNATILSGAIITADAAYEVTLKPGTIIEAGARFVVTMKDKDGMSNRCEMAYFQDLDEDAGDDFDQDGLLNYVECILGTDPTFNNPDTDGDDLPDWWEAQYSMDLDRLNGRNGDYDGDGISNWIEYRLGTDPTVINERGPGIYYKYDELGRIRKIERIPSQ